jgi:hypothetical protein
LVRKRWRPDSTRLRALREECIRQGSFMTESKRYVLSGQHGAEVFRTLPEGTTIKLLNGAVAEIVANPHDGGFILVKFLEHPQDPSKVGEEDYVFFNEVREAQ